MKIKLISALLVLSILIAIVQATQPVDSYADHQKFCYSKCSHYKTVKGKCSDYEWVGTKKECCDWKLVGKGKCLQYKRFSKCDKYSKSRKLCLGHGMFILIFYCKVVDNFQYQVTNKFVTSTKMKSTVSNLHGRICVSVKERTIHARNMPITLSVLNMTSHMSVPSISTFQKLVITTRRDVLNTRLTLIVPNISKSVNVKKDGKRLLENIIRDGLILTIMLFVNKNVTRFVPSIPRQRYLAFLIILQTANL